MLTLIKLLASGEVYSGERLGQAIGISRAAVWKYLQQLQGYGLNIDTARGVGYRLEHPLILLDQPRLARSANASVTSPVEVQVVSSIVSTNQSLYDAFNCGEQCAPIILFAEYQTQGRGRRGRPWLSPLGSNLYFSVGWPFSQGVNGLEGVSLAIGVALCRALEAMGIDSPRLKWPNDLLCKGKKLAGVLVEIGGDVSGECFIVVGVGLNVNMPTSAEIDQPWIDLRQLSHHKIWDRNQVAEQVLAELLPVFHHYSEGGGFAPYQPIWQSYNAYHNREVKVLAGNSEIHGRCLGVNPAGSLRLQVDGEEKLFSGGELSLRPC